MNPPQIIFIVGPTAVGKTSVALELAARRPGEIVSCDSMQVYREISIATNKPSSAERKRIPQHLIDVVSMSEEFDVAAFNTLALAAIRQIQERRKIPLVVGGTGMYMQVLLDGIFEDGRKDNRIRQELEARVAEDGAQPLYQELRRIDPAAAARIHPNDARRIIRAVEIFRVTQKPISELQEKRSGLWGHGNIALYALNRPREEIYRRINDRVDRMFEEGLVDEIKALEGKNLSQTARQIIGVSEVQGYLRGEFTREQAKDLMKMNTRHFAKRQLTWFRKEKRLTWVMMEESDTPQTICERLMS
jgi:tRNA dimethylallyltransferase